ncbi:MAG: hypothetical protein NVS1B3_13700 [Candidatus Dormibacteraceae bacterium]
MTANQAKVALILLVMMLFATQFGGVTLAHYYGFRLSGVADSYWQWNEYSRNPPEVLFIGDSRVREDVDVSAVHAIVSAQLGRDVRVGKIGFDSAQPRSLLAVMYRVTHQSPRPKWIFYGMSEYQYGSAYNFDPTYDFWNMSLPLDWGFLQLTYQIDTGNQERLVKGYLSPLEANQKVLETGAPCTVHDLKNVIARYTRIKLAGALAPLYPCTTSPGFAGLTMSADSRERGFAQYREIFANNFTYSEMQASYVRQAVAMARSTNVSMSFFVPPQYLLDDLNAGAYAEFENRTSLLAQELHLNRFDFHVEQRDSESLWADPAHLNRSGSLEFAPRVAKMVLSELPK